MNEEFGASYAALYDSLYGDKDYRGECEIVEDIFRRYAPAPVNRVLDLGCGSGNHAIPLARAGFTVVGADRSDAMLAHARQKAGAFDSCAFLQGDIRDGSFGANFDAALMMFAVLGYQVENQSVLDALKNARRHLRPGGLLLFDCWYGPAVLHERPSDRVKSIETPKGRATRTTTSTLNTRTHTCGIQFHIEVPGRQSFYERHAVRYFFPKELELYLEVAGFRMLRLGRFPDIHAEPDETSWNVWCVAQAKLEG